MKLHADKSMDITAVSFYTTMNDVDYNVYISDSLESSSGRQLFASGNQERMGWHIVKGGSVRINRNNDYYIIIQLTSKTDGYLIAHESSFGLDARKVRGEYFVSKSGSYWYDTDSGVSVNMAGVAVDPSLLIKVYGMELKGDKTVNKVGEYTLDGIKYTYYEGDLTWEEAAAHCEELGGQLATIDTFEKQLWLLANCPEEKREASFYYIGAYADGSRWRWLDGTPFSFANWSGGREGMTSTVVPAADEGCFAMIAMDTYADDGILEGRWVAASSKPATMPGFICQRR